MIVDYQLDDGVAVIRMDDGKANAYGLDMIGALTDAIDRAEREATSVVIAGRQGVFCAGFDLNLIRGDDDAARDRMRRNGRDLILRLYLHSQPVVMACTGHALAAGALLLLAADYRVGAEGDFKLGLNESAIGLSLPPFGVELARDRLDGRVLSDALVGARIFDPSGAVDAGYLDCAVSADQVLSTAIGYAREKGAYEQDAVSTTRRRLRHATVARIQAAED
ncbi:MAG: crotonase/enoyl-CoA hydratase family protein [Pseudomonadota bacterium]